MNTHNDYEGSPPKPPPPVLPQKPTKSPKQMKLDLVQQDSTGSDSTSSNVGVFEWVTWIECDILDQFPFLCIIGGRISVSRQPQP